jgi:hypothetical protein
VLFKQLVLDSVTSTRQWIVSHLDLCVYFVCVCVCVCVCVRLYVIWACIEVVFSQKQFCNLYTATACSSSSSSVEVTKLIVPAVRDPEVEGEGKGQSEIGCESLRCAATNM